MCFLIVGPVQFIPCLGMETGGACFWGFGAFVDITTVEAAPFYFAFPLKDFALLDIFPQREVALFVLLFYFGHFVEPVGDFFKDRKSTRLNSSHVRISY